MVLNDYIDGVIIFQCGGEHKDTAMRITNSLVNIRAITCHFQVNLYARFNTRLNSTLNTRLNTTLYTTLYTTLNTTLYTTLYTTLNTLTLQVFLQPRIESWLQKEQLSTPSEDQILEVNTDQSPVTSPHHTFL